MKRLWMQRNLSYFARLSSLAKFVSISVNCISYYVERSAGGLYRRLRGTAVPITSFKISSLARTPKCGAHPK